MEAIGAILAGLLMFICIALVKLTDKVYEIYDLLNKGKKGDCGGLDEK
jgi:hypothetical protein